MGYVGGSLTTFFDQAAQDLTRDAARKMSRKGGESIRDVTVMNTPVKTGELRASWKLGPTTPDPRGQLDPAWHTPVSTDVSYAPDVEYGTGLYGPKHAPYVIKPRNPGGMLRFVGRDGKVVFAKSVLHPGSPGNYMMAIGLNVTHAAVESGTLFRGVLEEWVRGVEGGAR